MEDQNKTNDATKAFQALGAAVMTKDAPVSIETESPEDPATPARSKKQDDEARAEVGEHKLTVVVKALRSIEQSLGNVIRLLEAEMGVAAPEGLAEGLTSVHKALKAMPAAMESTEQGRVVEGVFDGRNMVGSDGKSYSVPPNYASKSKLVEGDMLKLTISNTGTFIYKQIGPIERTRAVGRLGYDQTIGEYFVTADDKRWSVIKASVTYFKGEAGDEAVVLIPKNEPSKWAAVENIIKSNPL